MNDFPKPWLTEPHHVYALYAEDGHCLYVGCTINLVRRIQQHSVKAWWPEVARIESDRYPDRASGIAAETDRIRALNPSRNSVFTDHNPTSHGWEMRKARADARHEQGELCQPGTQCKRCNAIYKANGIRTRWAPDELRQRLAMEATTDLPLEVRGIERGPASSGAGTGKTGEGVRTLLLGPPGQQPPRTPFPSPD